MNFKSSMKLMFFICISILFISYSVATTAQKTVNTNKKITIKTIKKATIKKTQIHKKPIKKIHVTHKPKKSVIHKKSKAKPIVAKQVAQALSFPTEISSDLVNNKISESDTANKVQNTNTILRKKQPRLYSYSALVVDVKSGEILISKNPSEKLPIASITKLMMAMVVLDSGVDMDGYVTISNDDIDDLRNTFSRLKVGAQFRRRDLMLLALMSSENRAASALARTTFSGGTSQFVRKMNEKAISLGMSDTKFYDPTGLVTGNEASALDIAKMLNAAYGYDIIRNDTTTKSANISLGKNYVHRYINSDSLVRGDNMQIEVSKTGFINESGHCLALYTVINGREIIMVFLNSSGKSGRVVDAITVKNYVMKL